jgi:predicted cupin superfamily sugar epimerase
MKETTPVKSEADRIIEVLGLKPHPEGGRYRQMFADPAGTGGRAHSTAIYYLLKKDEISRAHRIDAAEIWHFYRGSPLELTIQAEGSAAEFHVLGAGVEYDERPQLVVPAHAWQAARPLGDYTLVGCTVAPGFRFETFEMAPEGFGF